MLFNMKINGELFKFIEIDNFVYEETIYGSSPFILEGRSGSGEWDVFDKFIHDPDTKVEIRWGYVDLKSDSDKWSSWYSVVCSRSKSLYDKSVGQIAWSLEGHDAGYRIKENITNKVYKDKPISAIVGEIASDNNLGSEISTTTGDYHLFQCNKDDGKFIREELIPRAYSGSSNAYACYFRYGKTLVFEPVGYGGLHDTYKNMDVAVYRNAPAYYSDRLNIEYRGFDPFKREKRFFKVNDGNAGYKSLGSSNPVSPPSGISKAVIGTAIEEDVFKDEAKSDWSQDYIGMHEFVVTVKDPSIQINKLAKVDFTNPAGEKLSISGKYVIARNIVEIENNVYNNRVYLARRS